MLSEVYEYTVFKAEKNLGLTELTTYIFHLFACFVLEMVHEFYKIDSVAISASQLAVNNLASLLFDD